MSIIIAAISMCCPVAGFFLVIAYFSTYRRAGISALLSGWTWGWALYGYIADSGNDIYRHMEHLALYKQVPFWQCFDLLRKSIRGTGALYMSQLYTWDIWLWIISKLNNPFLLQFSAAFLGYTIISYVCFDFIANNKINRWIIPFLTVLMLFSPLSICIGIRSANAMLICGLGVYIDCFYNKKKTAILLFIVAILLHHSCLLILACWFLYPAFERHKYIYSGVMALTLLLYTNYSYYLSLLSSSNSFLADLFTSTLRSANDYKNVSSISFHNFFGMVVNFAVCVLVLFRPVITFSQLLERKKDNAYENYKIWDEELLFFELTAVLSILLGVNGGRFFVITSILGITPFVESQFYNGFLKTKRLIIFDTLLFSFEIIKTALCLYDMNYRGGQAQAYYTVFWSEYSADYNKWHFKSKHLALI